MDKFAKPKIKRQAVSEKKNQSSKTTLTFTVEKQEIWNFFMLYDALGDKQKEIWNRICWFFKKYPNAHPTQSKIASGIPCSRKHVNRTLALFQKYGWLHLISRGPRRAKTLAIPDFMVNWHLIDREDLNDLKVTCSVPDSSSSSKNNSDAPHNSSDAPEWVKKLEIPESFKQKIALFPEHVFQEALHRARKIAKRGKTFSSAAHECSYFIGIMAIIAKEKGLKTDWRKFYARPG